MELCANEIVTDETRWILAILAAFQTPLLIPLMKKGMRRLMLIIYMLYAFIYNAFGGIVISAMTTVYGILAGKSNQTWFIGATMTQADFVLKWTGAALCAMLGGFLVAVYAIYIIGLAVFTTLMLVLPLIRLRHENRRLRIQMQEQYEYYQKVLETQMQLRETRHDLKNRLVAKTVAKEDRLRAKEFEDVRGKNGV